MESDPLFFIKKYTYYSWIIGLGLLVYANSLFNGFIWDDKTYIINNPQVHTLSLNLLFGQNWFNSAGFYRPIPALYFALLYVLFGNISFFYHVLQVGIHIVNVILVFALFKKFFNKPLAFFLSLIFLVHPVNTESVGYIAASDSGLFLFFGLSALLLSWQEKISFKKLAAICFLLLLSLLAKETGVLFVLLVLLSRWLFHTKQFVTYGIGLTVTMVVYSLLRVSVIGITYLRQNTVPIMQLTVVQRVMHIPAIIWYYVSTFFFPLRLAVSQNWTMTHLTLTNFYLPFLGELLLILGGVFLGVIFFGKKIWKPYLFFVVWLTAGLGMLLQIVPLDMTVADRWMYFPMIGIIGILGVFCEVVLGKHQKKTYVILAVCIVALFSLRTIFRNADWIDAQTLYSRDIAVSDDYNKEDGLAAELIAVGKYDDALQHAKQSVRLFPNFANINDIGVIYQHEGDITKAAEYYQKAIDAHPGTISPYVNLAAVDALYGNPALAIPIIQTILIKQYPNVSRFWVLLAIAQYKLGEEESAHVSANKAYVLLPNSQSIYLLNAIQNKLPADTLDIKQLE